jgi:hypothetical protein
MTQVLIVFNPLKSNIWFFFNSNNIFFKFINDEDNDDININNNIKLVWPKF